MNRDEELDAIQQFLDGGGKVTKLRYATQKTQIKAHRRWHHKDKALNGNHASKSYLEKEAKKEVSMIFSKDERWAIDE